MTDDYGFYQRTIAALLASGALTREMRVLVGCAGRPDRDLLHGLGFTHVTISNVDVRYDGTEFAPYPWSFQDAEHLDFPDGSFDACIVHNGLHHCYSPHRALLELYRVARRCVVVFEPRDTLLTRVGVKLNLGQEYEVAAVVGNDLRFGGVRNTAIPNFVYRWTEREIEKVVRCYDPVARPRFRYFYALRVPESRMAMMKRRLLPTVLKLSLPVLRLFTALFPRQSNCFGFVIFKPELPADLQPWLRLEQGQPVVDRDWVSRQYRKPK